MADELADRQSRIDMLEIFVGERIANIYNRLGQVEVNLQEVIDKMSEDNTGTDPNLVNEIVGIVNIPPNSKLQELAQEHQLTCDDCVNYSINHYIGNLSLKDKVLIEQTLEETHTLVSHMNKMATEIGKTPMDYVKENKRTLTIILTAVSIVAAAIGQVIQFFLNLR